MVKRTLLIALSITGASAALAAPALAAHPSAATLGGGGSDGVPRVVEKVLGGDVKLLDNGLYRVRTASGAVITTHGPDFMSDLDVIADAVANLGVGGPERDPICVANPATDYYQEVLYGYPSTGTNDLASEVAGIRAQVKRNNALLNAESLASGGGQADYKVRCDSGVIRVTAFVVPRSAGVTAASYDDVVSAADSAGFTNPKVDYTIFYDGDAGGSSTGACGVAGLWGDDSKSVDNYNNNPDIAGAGYGATFQPCWVGRTSMHENAHNQGAAQAGAPNSTGDGGHCNEDTDVLCYLDGGNLNQNYPQPCVPAPGGGSLRYDCGWNTYFDALPESGEWLDTHWNIGWSGNRFVQFGGPDTTDPETTILLGPSGPTADSTPSFTFESNELSATFKCEVDDATPDLDCTSPYTTPLLADGPHTVYVAATDSSGNADDSPASRAFSVDATPPDTAITTPPPATVTTSSVSIPFSSPESGATFQCKLDAAVFATCTSPAQLTGLSEGTHTFQVRARDALLNADPTPASATFTVDLPSGGGGGGGGSVGGDQDPPETTIIDGPPAKIKVKKKADVEFSFISDEAGSFRCSLDGAAFTVCTPPKEYNGLRKGNHFFAVEAVDVVGNIDPIAAIHEFLVKKKKKKKK